MVVFSPITHSHYIGGFLDDNLSHEFWLSQDAPFIDFADELWVLQLPGWDKSFGVIWEIGYATGQGKDITYITWEEVESWYENRATGERIDGHA